MVFQFYFTCDTSTHDQFEDWCTDTFLDPRSIHDLDAYQPRPAYGSLHERENGGCYGSDCVQASLLLPQVSLPGEIESGWPTDHFPHLRG